MKNINTNPAVVASRTTFDGVRVFLHADGQVSSIVCFLRGRLPMDVMWRVADDFCLYAWDELPALLRDVRSGRWAKRVEAARQRAITSAVPESERVYMDTFKLANGLMACVRVK